MNLWLQTRVTKRLPIPDHKLEALPAIAANHVDAFRTHGSVPLSEARFFEFGAGWDLGVPLCNFALGVPSQVVVDLHPVARPELVDDMVRRLAASPTLGPEAADRLACTVDQVVAERDVREKVRLLGIEYRAPCDARRTGLPDGSFDCVTSTATLEHIPPDDILAILRECHRLLSPGGVVSCNVDLSDHYATFDGSISAYNFLRYSDRRWRAFNPPLHYQNRLRHSQYLEIADQAGFDIAAIETSSVGAEELALVGAVPLAQRFQAFSSVDLAIVETDLVLVKR